MMPTGDKNSDTSSITDDDDVIPKSIRDQMLFIRKALKRHTTTSAGYKHNHEEGDGGEFGFGETPHQPYSQHQQQQQQPAGRRVTSDNPILQEYLMKQKKEQQRSLSAGVVPRYQQQQQQQQSSSTSRMPPMESAVGKKWQKKIMKQQQKSQEGSAAGTVGGDREHKKVSMAVPPVVIPPADIIQPSGVFSAMCVGCEVKQVQLRDLKAQLDDVSKKLTESHSTSLEWKRKYEVAVRAEKSKSAEYDTKTRQLQVHLDGLRLEIDKAQGQVKDANTRLHEGVSRERQLRQQQIEELRAVSVKELEASRIEWDQERQQLRLERDRILNELKSATNKLRSLEAEVADMRSAKEEDKKSSQDSLVRMRAQLTAASEEIHRLSLAAQSVEALKARETRLSNSLKELMDGVEETMRRQALQDEEYRRGALDIQHKCELDMKTQARKLQLLQDKALKYKQKLKEARDEIFTYKDQLQLKEKELELKRDLEATLETKSLTLQQKLDQLTEQHRKVIAAQEETTRRALKAEEEAATVRRRCAQLERNEVQAESTTQRSITLYETRASEAERRERSLVEEMKSLQQKWESEKAHLTEENRTLRSITSRSEQQLYQHPTAPPSAPRPRDADNSDEDDDPILSSATKQALEKQMKLASTLESTRGFEEPMQKYKQQIKELVEMHKHETEKQQLERLAVQRQAFVAKNGSGFETSSDEVDEEGDHPQHSRLGMNASGQHTRSLDVSNVSSKKTTASASSGGRTKGGGKLKKDNQRSNF